MILSRKLQMAALEAIVHAGKSGALQRAGPDHAQDMFMTDLSGHTEVLLTPSAAASGRNRVGGGGGGEDREGAGLSGADLLGVDVHARKPAAKAWMAVIPSDHHLWPADQCKLSIQLCYNYKHATCAT